MLRSNYRNVKHLTSITWDLFIKLDEENYVFLQKLLSRKPAFKKLPTLSNQFILLTTRKKLFCFVFYVIEYLQEINKRDYFVK